MKPATRQELDALIGARVATRHELDDIQRRIKQIDNMLVLVNEGASVKALENRVSQLESQLSRMAAMLSLLTVEHAEAVRVMTKGRKK